jgi:hypothetical protein
VTGSVQDSTPVERQLSLDHLMEDRDYLFRLVNTIDWDLQLEAINGVLRRNHAASQAVSAQIEELRQEAETYRGPYQDRLVDEHVDAIFRSSYSEAANSMAAIGMIVPMLESVYSQSFYSLGEMFEAKTMKPPAHQRWDRAGDHPKRWNCQVYFGEDGGAHQDIIRGIRQISAATGLIEHLPSDTSNWIDAMLTYRNKMFHGGFEWSLAQRDQFEKQIAERRWDRFFESATTNGKPWIFYLTDEAIAEMPTRMEAILDGMGRFAKSLPFALVSIEG